jgi:hypothetical protein
MVSASTIPAIQRARAASDTLEKQVKRTLTQADIPWMYHLRDVGCAGAVRLSSTDVRTSQCSTATCGNGGDRMEDSLCNKRLRLAVLRGQKPAGCSQHMESCAEPWRRWRWGRAEPKVLEALSAATVDQTMPKEEDARVEQHTCQQGAALEFRTKLERGMF